ncbi:MAG: hypothetical protein ABW321_13015 [Polyangiales bacterium]
MQPALRLRPSCLSLIALAVVASVCASVSVARAQQRYAMSPDRRWAVVQPAKELPPLFEPDDKLRLFGLSVLVGFPDGIAPGVAVHPGTNLVHLDLALSGLLSFGMRASVTLDPFDWVVAPTLTIAGGFYGWAQASADVDFQLSYLNIQPGIELGRRSRFRIFLRVGYSHLWVTGRSKAAENPLPATSDPSLRIHFFPSLNLGITTYMGS